ncbi:thiamine ABC transporter substrate-binding protein, partial [Anaerosalibacter bizertensis]|nr:thiamine ABC transporter substrate-binding protein [Anaerosalibacter bizertensis]
MEEFLGNYDYYVEKKNQIEEVEEEDSKTKTQIKLEKKKERKKIEEKRKIKRKATELENQIILNEEKIVNIDEKLSDPNIYDNLEKVKQLTEKREETQRLVEKLYDELINLED